MVKICTFMYWKCRSDQILSERYFQVPDSNYLRDSTNQKVMRGTKNVSIKYSTPGRYADYPLSSALLMNRGMSYLRDSILEGGIPVILSRPYLQLLLVKSGLKAACQVIFVDSPRLLKSENMSSEKKLSFSAKTFKSSAFFSGQSCDSESCTISNVM